MTTEQEILRRTIEFLLGSLAESNSDINQQDCAVSDCFTVLEMALRMSNNHKIAEQIETLHAEFDAN